MDLAIITGNSVFTRALFYIAAIFVVADLIITLFAIFYQRVFYDRFIRPKFDKMYTPRCAIIVPCKGLPKELGNNLRGFLELDYPDYKVIYSVESEIDEAVPVIKEIIAGDTRTALTVAGLSTQCVQKNHNLLAGLQRASDAEVYVFADADIKPDPLWLRELVLPLVNEKNTVTSGFRWLMATKGSIGELAHCYVNAVIYIFFSTACFFGGVGLWGGSMAIRKKDFDELKVAEKWSHAGVDDMSLSYLVLKARRKAILVPHCVIKTDDLIQTVKGTVCWFERQCMYLKAYQKPLWLFIGFPMVLIAVLLLFLLPVSITLAISSDKSFFAVGGGAALLFYVGELFTVSLYRFLGSMYSMWKFYVLWPFLRFSQAVSYLLTALTDTITWAGIKYKIAFNGDVSRIERP